MSLINKLIEFILTDCCIQNKKNAISYKQSRYIQIQSETTSERPIWGFLPAHEILFNPAAGRLSGVWIILYRPGVTS